MASGPNRLTAMNSVAGANRAVAVNPSPGRRSMIATGRGARAMSVIPRSPLERLVPPILEVRVVFGHVTVVEIDEQLLLVFGEADALLDVGRHLGIGDGRVVAHVDSERLLCRRRHHGVEIGVGAGLV